MNKNCIFYKNLSENTRIFPGRPMLLSSVPLKTHFTVPKASYETVNYGSFRNNRDGVQQHIKVPRSFTVKKPVELIAERFLFI